MRTKNVFLICGLMLVMSCCFEDCNPLGPDNDEIVKTRDTVEFMYQRTLPIVDNSQPDPKGTFSIWHDTFGGRNATKATYLGNDQWVAEATLNYIGTPYWIYTIDMKVTGEYMAVAETFYARIKGNSEWIKLTYIEVIRKTGEPGAKFYLTSTGIKVP